MTKIESYFAYARYITAFQYQGEKRLEELPTTLINNPDICGIFLQTMYDPQHENWHMDIYLQTGPHSSRNVRVPKNSWLIIPNEGSDYFTMNDSTFHSVYRKLIKESD